jgi:hypothetical protein
MISLGSWSTLREGSAGVGCTHRDRDRHAVVDRLDADRPFDAFLAGRHLRQRDNDLVAEGA